VSSTHRRTRRRRRGVSLSTLLRGLALWIAFLVGLAVGSGIEDNPDGGETRTYVRTLQPRPLAPAQTTVTTTITVRTG
jgi:hypothetical protein